MVKPQTILCLCLLVFATGCASDAEREAFQDWVRISEATYRQDWDKQARNWPSAASSQNSKNNSLGPEPTLDDYLAYAALHNPKLEAAFNRWKAQLERIPQVRSLPDPRFNYRYFIENVETRVGPQRQRFGLSQMFPWFGKLELRAGVALEEARKAQAEYEAQKLRLFFKVTKTYYEYYYLAQAIEVVRENRELVKYLEEVARTRFKAAAGGHPDVIRAQVELGKLDDRLRTLEDLRGSIVSRLNAALGRQIHAALPWPKKLTYMPIHVDERQLFSELPDSNPELRSLRHQIAREHQSIRLARKDYYPDITLGVDYIDTGSAVSPGVSDSGQDAVAVGFSINIPIWHEKYSAGVREGLARFGAATKKRVDRENVLQAELKTSLYHLNDAERKISLYRDTLVPKAKQSIKATEAAFRAGTSTFIDLIDAERLLLEFQLEYERALAGRETRLAELEMLVGGEIPSAPMPSDTTPTEHHDEVKEP